MKTLILSFTISLFSLPVLAALFDNTGMTLPKPQITSKLPVEQAVKNRRTIRRFKRLPLTLDQFSRLLWASYGITGENGLFKTVPSAGALYPLNIWAVAGKNCIEGIEPGVYEYLPQGHRIRLVKSGDQREQVARASLNQIWMAEAPVIFVITGEYERCSQKYGKRGIRYTDIEAGHSGQNLFLEAEALGLAAGIVGAFHDDLLKEVLNLNKSYEPLLAMPVGYKAARDR